LTTRWNGLRRRAGLSPLQWCAAPVWQAASDRRVEPAPVSSPLPARRGGRGARRRGEQRDLRPGGPGGRAV